jgi:hypothetical protein
MEIRPVGAELFHANGRTDITQLLIAFRNFANEPKNWTRQKKQPFWIHPAFSHTKHVPSFVSESTPRSTVRLQRPTVARLVERFVALYGTGHLLTCLHILALTFTWPSSPQSIPKKRLTLPYITRSTKCSLSFIHSHIHMPHVSAIQLLFQHVKVVLRYAVSLTVCEQATTT